MGSDLSFRNDINKITPKNGLGSAYNGGFLAQK